MAEWTRNPHVTPERRADRQYVAAFLLFDDLRRSDKRRACFEHVTADGLDKAGLLEAIRPWSHGEQVIVKTALDLFDRGCVAELGHTPAGWGEAAAVLDPDAMRHVIQAIRVARGETRAVLPAGDEGGLAAAE